MYYLLDERPSCCGQTQESNELITCELLAEKSKHLHIVMAGVCYDICEEEKRPLSKLRDANIARYKKKYIRLHQMHTNICLIQEKVEEAALYGSLTNALKCANVTLDQMLERLQNVDKLMDCLRNHGDNLQEIQTLLGDPLRVEMSDDDDKVVDDIVSNNLVFTKQLEPTNFVEQPSVVKPARIATTN